MESSYGAMPGLKGVDHVGFTVPDLEQAVTFFETVLGCQTIYRLGPFKDDDGDWMREHLNVDPRAEITAIAILRCYNGSNLEIFEYNAPKQHSSQPKNSDIGGHHIAFYVTDMNKAVRYLQENGIPLLGEPTVMETGPSAGESWVYFMTPWGMQLELVSYPQGKAYEKTTSLRLFSPAFS
ncbi:VOC family protein [Kistimonas scapharcae]|uniref:VOC family protein n=1 Tax=Kistimonas scapharcae TaxID=1036133 RepID=A0ABP8V331_9GAMM